MVRTPLVAGLTAGLAIAALPATAAAAPSGTAARQVRDATRLGTLPTQPLSITLSLAPRDAGALRTLAATAHAPLTAAQFAARFAPTGATVAAVRGWATAHHLAVTSVTPDHLLVTLSGSSTAIATALHTRFARFRAPSVGSYYATTGAARLPARLAPKVDAVLGLSSLDHLSPAPLARPSATTAAGTLAAAPNAASIAYPAAYGPKDFWSIYHAPATQTGTGQRLAIITTGDVSSPRRDLATFERTYGLGTVTWNQINVGTPSTDTSGADEWDLDSQYSTGFAPGVTQLDDYNGSSLSNADIATTIDRFVTDNRARQGSFSAGECELLAAASGFATTLDTILAEAAAHGQTMFFSSGDTGSQCPVLIGVNGVPAGLPGDNYPASSPYGIGVGGTSVLAPSGPNEVAWYAGGGGPSDLEPVPAFQARTAVGGIVGLATRGVPDVALDADPESGYHVVVGGRVETIGGTSASAPSWQGIWARAQGAHAGTLGFAGPVLYSTVPATAFHDITVGTNTLFPALPGWDYDTGRGTPDISALVAGA